MEHDLRHLLDELSTAITRTKGQEEREELTRLLGAVESRLEGDGSESDDPGGHAGLLDGLEKAEIRFESDHPTLAESLRQAIQALSSAGI